MQDFLPPKHREGVLFLGIGQNQTGKKGGFGYWNAVIRKQISLTLIVFLAFFHLISALFGAPITIIYYHLHLGFMMIICFLNFPLIKKHPNSKLNVADYILIIITALCILYVITDAKGFQMRSGIPNADDLVVGTIFILLICEAGRRVAGGIMVVLALFFTIQNLIADKLPGIFYGPPMMFKTMIDMQYIRSEGIFGVPFQTISSYVILFLIFASLLTISGAGQFFIDLALSFAGRSRGGPAKTAIIASGCSAQSRERDCQCGRHGLRYHSMMKKIGYAPAFAGAVEAVASTGGQIMPPMMGAAAFIMASTLGMHYISLAAAAVIPAILYYVSLYFMVDFRAAKTGLVGLPAENLPKLWPTLCRGGHLLLPLVVVIGLMAIGRSPQYSALCDFYADILSYARKWTRMDGTKVLQGIFNGVKDTASISVTAGVAGLIVGGVGGSGLGLVFAQQLFGLSRGNLVMAMIMVAICSLILGMGMTTTAVYVTVATIMAPALVNMGIEPLAAHMFVFYFGILCTITPPVAMAAYTGAGIAGADPARTGWTAFRLGIAAYIVPFMFVYGPQLLLIGSASSVVLAIATACIGVWMLAGCAEGWLFAKATVSERVLMGIGSIVCIIPGWQTDLMGIFLLLVVIAVQKRRSNKLAVVK
jgi:TRAP transporter 4TM/12TM fusion protein